MRRIVYSPDEGEPQSDDRIRRLVTEWGFGWLGGRRRKFQCLLRKKSLIREKAEYTLRLGVLSRVAVQWGRGVHIGPPQFSQMI